MMFTEHEAKTFARVTRELGGRAHVADCPNKKGEPGPGCSHQCAVIRCVFNSLTSKAAQREALDNRHATD